MKTAAYALNDLGALLLLIVFVRSVWSAVQRRDRGRIDTALFFLLLVVEVFLRGGPYVSAVRMVALALVPWALLRLLPQFGDLPRWAAPLAFVLALVAPAIRVIDVDLVGISQGVTGVYRLVGAALVGVLFAIGAGRSTGSKRRRLAFAATGAGALMISAAPLIVDPILLGRLSSQVVPIVGFTHGIALICFYFAFATPRPLLARWRRMGQTEYLAQAMKRDPEDRGRRAADDLLQGAIRSVGGAVTIVALRDTTRPDALRVTAASDPALVGKSIVPAGGLFGRVLSSARPAVGLPGTCEPDLDAEAVSHGGSVLVAPIAAGAAAWGVVAVAHRRGALFPEDDLEVLAEMARNAATALDHYRLITDRRRQERREAEARLREIETRVDLMLDSIKDYAMLVLEADGRIAAWHLGAEHVFGHQRAAIAGQPAAPIYEMSPAEFAAWLQEARLHGRAEREGPCRRADGSTFTGATMIRPLVEETDGTPGFVVVTQDVTDRRDLEDRLRQGQKMEAIGQLAGGVAHDFNNLLTAILGYSDWLDRELTGDPRRGQVTEIQKAAERAADLTRQLLAFSRRQELCPAALDLSEVTGDLVPMLRRIIGEQVEIVANLQKGLPAIVADRSQIERIILNLAVNARDAMPSGGRLTIRVGEAWLEEGDPAVSGGFPSGPYALLEVADTGTGMSDETRSRVFEPFFTTKEVGRGTGLGLSTVYGIVKQMGGAIDLESELDRGTTFRLYFPQAATTVEPRPVEVPFVPAASRKSAPIVKDEADVLTPVARTGTETAGRRRRAGARIHRG